MRISRILWIPILQKPLQLAIRIPKHRPNRSDARVQLYFGIILVRCGRVEVEGKVESFFESAAFGGRSVPDIVVWVDILSDPSKTLRRGIIKRGI